MSEGKEISVSLMPDGENPVDPGGTAVNFDTDFEHFGKVCVGYSTNKFDFLKPNKYGFKNSLSLVNWNFVVDSEDFFFPIFKVYSEDLFFYYLQKTTSFLDIHCPLKMIISIIPHIHL